MRLVLLICYPLCVHLGIVAQQAIWQWLAIVCLAGGIQYTGLRQGSVFAWAVLLLVIAAALWMISHKLAHYIFYLPPIVLPLLIGTGFLRTLMPGEVPLVTAIGREVHGQLPPNLERYTHRVTLFWFLFLLAMAIVAALLPWLGTPLIWSWFSNCLNYVLVAVVFVGEYAYRRWRFSDFPQPSFRDYLAIVANSESKIGRRF